MLFRSTASSETLNGNSNGHAPSSLAHFELRDLAASIVEFMCTKYSASNQGLKARVSRTCLKLFLDPRKPLGTHYGALRALILVTGKEGLRMLVLPNLALYDTVLREAMADEAKRPEAERVIAVILRALDGLDQTRGAARLNGVVDLDEQKEQLTEKVGEVLAEKIVASGRFAVAHIILNTDMNL